MRVQNSARDRNATYGCGLMEFVENSRHPDPWRVRNGGPELRLVALIRRKVDDPVDPVDPRMKS